MKITDLDHVDAVHQAMHECQILGRVAFLEKYGFGPATQYHVTDGERLYDPKAIVAAAFKIQFPGHQVPQFSGGEAAGAANDVLRRLKFEIIDGKPRTPEGELRWRKALWSHLNSVGGGGPLSLRAIREYKVFYGERAIWFDKTRTAAIVPSGVAVSVLNTGRHYAGEFDGSSAIYHYPTTPQSGNDDAEVAATKAAADLGLPIFVITPNPADPQRRIVRLGWVEGWDDASRTFLLALSALPPAQVYRADESDGQPFELTGNTRRRADRTVTLRPSQPRFKLRVFQRYGPRCPLSGIAVPEMIDAAHLRPVADDGSDDPRNGLPLNAALHRALDAGLFAIHPDTLEVITRPQGPTLAELGVITPHLGELPKKPHPDALRWRYDRWLRAQNGSETDSTSGLGRVLA